MKKLLLALSLLALIAYAACPAYAGEEDGLYYDTTRDGEGILLLEDEGRNVFYFYTYDPYQGCWGIDVPESGLVTEDNCHEQRWFFSAGDRMVDGQIQGYLYKGLGLGYPKGVPDLKDPFKSYVGEAHIVGIYILQPTVSISGGGYQLLVVKFGGLLEKDDPLYNRIFDFNTKLFGRGSE